MARRGGVEQGAGGGARGGVLEFREQVLEEDPELLPTLDAALAELERPPRLNHVAHALVWRAALELMTRADRNYERMAELEQALAAAPPAAHRRLALPVAAAATLAADVGDEEAAQAIARFVVSLPHDPAAVPDALERATARFARCACTRLRGRVPARLRSPRAAPRRADPEGPGEGRPLGEPRRRARAGAASSRFRRREPGLSTSRSVHTRLGQGYATHLAPSPSEGSSAAGRDRQRPRGGSRGR